LLQGIQRESSDDVVTAILHAVGSGRQLGDMFVDACFPLVPFLLEKAEEMASHPLKCGMMTCLCGLFLASSYGTALRFSELGFFEFLVQFSDQMLANCGREIVDTLQKIFGRARDNENAQWMEFLLSDPISELLEIMIALDNDFEVNLVAQGLLEDLGKFEMY
jgi:hypothetical protein